MAEIDPIILQLRADMSRYLSDINRATTRVNSQLGSQADSVRRLESQFRTSTGQISSSLKGLAAGLAASFGASSIIKMADSYTRFTNQLKVAGLEGSNLADVQERLFEIAQRNGVELEAVGTLYSRAAQNQKELGASTEDLLSLTKAVSASLRISGTSTEEASGALLQLGQALGAPRIQAEEFNSLLDTMQPLLREASKYIDGTGDSLSGLTRKIKDTSGAGVSNVEFFNAITQAMAALEDQASKTNLTISAAFTNLSSAITKYVGEADQANGASAALVSGIDALARNLDTVTEALAVLAAFMLGRFVSGFAASAAAAVTLSAANTRAALTAEALAGATYQANAALLGEAAAARIAAGSVSGLAVASAGAASAGSALLAVFGGPVGLAITAVAVSIGVLAKAESDAQANFENLTNEIDAQAAKYELLNTNQAKTKAATGELTDAQKAALTATANLTGEANLLANAWARVAAEAKRAAIAQAQADLSRESRARRAAQRAIDEREDREQSRPSNQSAGGVQGVVGRIVRAGVNAFNPESKKRLDAIRQQQDKNLEIATANEAIATKILNETSAAMLKTFDDGATAAASGASGSNKKTGGAGRAGPAMATDADQQERLDRIILEELQARLNLATTAQQRLDIQREILAAEKSARFAEIDADKRYTDAQKAAQKQALEALYGSAPSDSGDITVRPGLISRQINQDYEDAVDQVNLSILRNQQDVLEDMASMEPNRARRKELEENALAIQQQIEKALLKESLERGELANATQEQKDQAVKNLETSQGVARDRVARNNESPLEQRKREATETAANIGDVIEQSGIDAMDRFGDSIANAATQYIKLGGIAGDVINGIIQDLIKLAAKQAIMGVIGGGGIGGAISGIGKALGFRAAGGSVVGGAGYIVGENGPEYFRPSGSGNIISNRQLNQTAGRSGGGTTVKQVVNVDARNSVNPTGFAQQILAMSGQQAQRAAGSMGANVMKAVPGRVASYQRDGT